MRKSLQKVPVALILTPVFSCFWTRGREEEEEELNRSLQIALNRLRGQRDYERLSPEQRRLLQTSDPDLQYKVRQGRPLSNDKEGLIFKAVASLTDDQIKTLGQTGSVSVPDFIVPSETVAWMLEKNPPIINPLAVNRDMRPPSDAVLTLGYQDSWKGMYAVSLNFRSGFPSQLSGFIGLDTLDIFASEEALDPAANAEAGPAIDLLSEVKGKPGQKPLVSLPAALNLLARKAHINIYAETFVHPQQVLRFPKGSPTYVLTHLCADFGYRWLKVGTEYLVYSKSWAEDRAADISQPELERIIAKRILQGHYELKDYIEWTRKNDLQLKTLEKALGITGPFIGGNKNAIRLLNALNMDDLPIAYTEQGALLTELTPAYAVDLQAVFRQRPVTLPVRVKLEVSANGVGIQFADQEGKSHEWWAYQGNKPGGRSFMPKQLSFLEADGSYPPPWGTASQ